MPNNRKIVYWLDQTKFYRISIHYRQINTLFGYEIGFYKANGNLKKEHQEKNHGKIERKLNVLYLNQSTVLNVLSFFTL